MIAPPTLVLAALLASAPAVLANPVADTGTRERLAALGCASCHDELASAGVRTAPDLARTVTLLDPAYVRAFISEPHARQPGSRMPDLLSGFGATEREEAAAALAAFLGSVVVAGEAPSGGDAVDARRGERLYRDLGCVQCHGPRGEGAGDRPADLDVRSLDHVAEKYTRGGLAAFLFQPLEHRAGGLMPDMHLSSDEARDLATWLAPDRERSAVPAGDVARGRELFGELGCASCHDTLGVAAPRRAGALEDTTAGCLADDSAPGVPAYDLEAGERAELREAIASLARERAPEEELRASLSAFRCTACHDRGDLGGVHPALDVHLVTEEPELGEFARRPPSLTGVGAKLRREWLERVIYDGASVRSYLRTRMPVFGAENVAHLPELFASLDAEEPLLLPKPEGEADREARDAARQMLGTTGLACVSCHAFNAQRGPGFQGIDLVTAPERLNERWFRDFLVDPESRLPGVVMPESWPGGVAAYDTLLDGDTDRQIAALWHFLTLGRSAPNPKGINPPAWKIDVGERPRVYRGRSRVAGFRGIAVGFPEGLHYAFDAQNGSLAAIWRGDFLSVNWNGQGAGDFNPRARAAELARDVALLEGAEVAAWPVRPRTTKEEPVNPDPTYPSQHGYRFDGYRLDEGGVPTLRYRAGAVRVEDRSVVDPADRARLVRTLTFVTDGPDDASLQMRAMTGEIEALGDGRYRSGRVALTVLGGSAECAPSAAYGDLRFALTLPSASSTTLELAYDLLD